MENLSEDMKQLQIDKEKQISLMIGLVQHLPVREMKEDCYFKTRINRDEDVESLLAAVENNYDLFSKKQSTSIQQWKAISIFTGAGAGKTYFTYFLNSILADYWKRNPDNFDQLKEAFLKAKILRVYTKQTNGTKMQEEEDTLFFLIVTIASILLVRKQDPLNDTLYYVDKSSLIEMIKQKNLYHAFQNIDLVMECIRKVQEIGENEKIWILFGHDELQAFVSPSVLHNSSTSIKDTSVYKYITSAMNIATKLATIGKDFLLSTFTGTFPFHFTNLLVGTNYQFESIILKALKPEQGIELLLNERDSPSPLFKSTQFRTLIELCGNIPRIWRVLDQSLNSLDPSDFNPITFLNYLKNEVKKEYNLTVNLGKWIDEAVFVMVNRWDLGTLNSSSVPEVLSSRIKTLMYDGAIFIGDGDSFFIPIIFLFSVISSEPSLYKTLFVDFMIKSLEGSFNSIDFEEFIIKFICLKQNLFSTVLGLSKVTVGQMFPGAFMNEETRSFEIEWEKSGHLMEFKKGNDSAVNLDELKTKGHFSQPIDVKDSTKSYAIHIGGNNEYCDGLITICAKVSIMVEAKYSTELTGSQTFQGKEKDGFEHAQEMFKKSKLQLSASFFLYITNAKVGHLKSVENIPQLEKELEEALSKHSNAPRGKKTEMYKPVSSLQSKLKSAQKNKAKVEGLMESGSIIIHELNWRKMFSSIFIFINPRQFNNRE